MAVSSSFRRDVLEVLRTSPYTQFGGDVEIRGDTPSIDVRSYGAKGNGVADDTQALMDAWDALPANSSSAPNGVLFLPPGVYMVSDTVEWQDKFFITVMGYGAQIKTKSGSSFGSTKGVVRVIGTRHSSFHGLRVTSDLTSGARPAALWIMGRTALDGSYNSYYSMWWDGAATLASVYNCGSEVLSFYHCKFYANQSGQVTLYDTSTDAVQNLIDGNAQSDVGRHYYSCQFQHQVGGTATTDLITLAGVTQETTFDQCYWHTNATGVCRALYLKDETAGDGFMGRLMVMGGRFEQSSAPAGTRFIWNAKTLGNGQMVIRGFNWTPQTATYMIEDTVSGTNASEVDWWPAGAQKFAHIVSPAVFRSNKLFGNLNASIDVDSGAFATENFVWLSNAGFPFAGAGTYEGLLRQDNIVLCSGGTDAYVSIPAGRRRMNVFSDGDTTPSVKGLELHATGNTGATSITAFDTSEVGQHLIVFVKDANTTFVHTAAATADTLKMAGAVNWAAPNGAMIEFQRDDRTATPVWRETSRTLPAQEADVGALTDNSGGTADNTIAAMPDPADAPADADTLREDIVANLLPPLRNNMADVAEQLNAIRTVLRNRGIMA